MDSVLKNADEALKEREEISVMTSGISMLPLFKQGRDIVVIERVKRPLKRGDVPLYKTNSPERFILHRIIRVKKDSYVIRGDNLYVTEYGIKNEDIIGVLKAFYRNGKYVNCADSIGYKLYSFYIMNSFPLRFLYEKKIRPILSYIKHKVFKL